MGEYDKSSKWLLEHHGDAMLRLAGVTGIRHWRALAAEVVQPRQLPDGVLEVELASSERPVRHVVEVATYPEPRIGEQAATDAALVWQATGELPEVIVLVLRPRGPRPAPREFTLASPSGRTQLRVQWQVVELWNVPEELLLGLNDPGILPLVPLAASQRSPNEVMRDTRDRIEKAAPPEEKAALLAVTSVFSRLRYTRGQIAILLKGLEPVRDF